MILFKKFCNLILSSFIIGIELMAFEIDSRGICQIEGVEYPAIGYGTYPLQDEVCAKAISFAAEVGYRIIDTATFYNNFEAISTGLKDLGRENFYIISKVWPDAHKPELLRKDLKTTLDRLQTPYLDAYLLHWPNSKVSIEDTLLAMDELRIKGLIRHIGLSNITVNHLKKALEINVPISWVQVEMNPHFCDFELLKFCQSHAISIQAWAPFSRGRLSQDPFLSELGKKYSKTASQIALRWILQHKCIPLPGSKDPSHMKENFEITDFALSDEDMKAIDQRAQRGKRERVTKEADVGFTDEFDFSYEECWPKKK